MRWVRPGSGRAPVRAPGRRAPAGRRGLHLRDQGLDRVPPRDAAAAGAGPRAQRRCSIARFVQAALDLAARGFDVVVSPSRRWPRRARAATAGAGRRRRRRGCGRSSAARSSTSCAAHGLTVSTGMASSRSMSPWPRWPAAATRACSRDDAAWPRRARRGRRRDSARRSLPAAPVTWLAVAALATGRRARWCCRCRS